MLCFTTIIRMLFLFWGAHLGSAMDVVLYVYTTMVRRVVELPTLK